MPSRSNDAATACGPGTLGPHGRLRAREHPPGKPFAEIERQPLAQRFEFGSAGASVPRAHAAKALVVRACLPDCAELPAQRAADRLERCRVDLDRSLGFREDLRDFMLDALQDLRVNNH